MLLRANTPLFRDSHPSDTLTDSSPICHTCPTRCSFRQFIAYSLKSAITRREKQRRTWIRPPGYSTFLTFCYNPHKTLEGPLATARLETPGPLHRLPRAEGWGVFRPFLPYLSGAQAPHSTLRLPRAEGWGVFRPFLPYLSGAQAPHSTLRLPRAEGWGVFCAFLPYLR